MGEEKSTLHSLSVFIFGQVFLSKNACKSNSVCAH